MDSLREPDLYYFDIPKPNILTLDGQKIAVNDENFDCLSVGQTIFYEGQLAVITELDKKRRTFTAGNAPETVIPYLK